MTVTVAPALTTPGAIASIRGCCAFWSTTKSVLLATLWLPTVTDIGPVTAPAGTSTRSSPTLPLTTVAGMPAKRQ